MKDINKTRAVQPVATCRQSPYFHKPTTAKLLLLIYGFYSARNARIASAVLATAIPSVHLSVCPSVCLSVTRRYCVKTTAESDLPIPEGYEF